LASSILIYIPSSSPTTIIQASVLVFTALMFLINKASPLWTRSWCVPFNRSPSWFYWTLL